MSKKTGIDLELHQLAMLAPAGYFIGLHIRFAAPLITFQTYDRAWLDHYTEQAYAMRDPMIAWGFSQEGHVRWSEIQLPDPFEIFRQAGEYGLKFGAAVALGSMQSRTIAGAARPDREFDDAELDQFAKIIATLHRITEPPESLSQAQREALRLIAAGHRHAAAADIIGISESALKARLNAARNKLLARTTAEAIQRAQEYRLL